MNLEIDGEILRISDNFDGFSIAEHKISKNKGELIQNNNHKRDSSEKLDVIQEALLISLGGGEDAGIFLRQLRCLKPRYARDQFDLAKDVIKNHSHAAVEKALGFCVSNSLFSAVEFRNAAEYFEARLEKELEQVAELPKVTELKTHPGYKEKRPVRVRAGRERG